VRKKIMKNQFRVNSGSFYIDGKRYRPPDVFEHEASDLHTRYPHQITLLSEEQAKDPKISKWGTTAWTTEQTEQGWFVVREGDKGKRILNTIPLGEMEARGFLDDHSGELKKHFRCPRIWKAEDEVIVLGGGPSLKGFDFSRLKDRRVIACNDAYRYGDWDIMHFGDQNWWRHNYLNAAIGLKDFRGLKTTSCGVCLQAPDVKVFCRKDSGMGSTNWELGWNASTGASAIGLAMLLGSERIYLLGFDMKISGNRNNFYPNPLHKANQESCKKHLKGVRNMVSSIPVGVGIKNICTDPESPLDMFERVGVDIILPPRDKTAKTAVSKKISSVPEGNPIPRRRRKS